jgi:hypothetical protein
MKPGESDNTPYPSDIRNEMGEKLWNMIQTHPQEGKWKIGVMAWGLMLNSSGHPDGNTALKLVVEDVENAHRLQVPVDVIRFALGQVYEWRKIQLEAQGRRDGEIVRGEITPEILKKELKNKIPQTYLDAIFLKPE